MDQFQHPLGMSFIPPHPGNTMSWDDYELYPPDTDLGHPDNERAAHLQLQLSRIEESAKNNSSYAPDFAQYAPFPEGAAPAYQAGFLGVGMNACFPPPGSDQASSPWSADLSSISEADSPRMDYGGYPSPPCSYDYDEPSVPRTDIGYTASDGSEQSVALCQVQQYPDLDFGMKLEQEMMHVSPCVCPTGGMVYTQAPQYEEPDAVSDVSGNQKRTETAASPDITMSLPRPAIRRGKSGHRVNKRQTASRAAKSSPRSSGSSDKNATARTFTCSFSHYGCSSTFVSKNEWKRHVASQHLQLGFYRCDIGSCNVNSASPKSRTTRARETASPSRIANDFNRKDLFTQHQRRMHTPWQRRDIHGPPTEEDKAAFEHSLEGVRARCWVQARYPPARSQCGFCGKVFSGPHSWDERMEHVGRHFEKDDTPLPPEVEDGELTQWAAAEGIVRPVQGRWRLTSLCEA